MISVCVCSIASLCDPLDCSPPEYPVPGVFQARILEWVAIPFSRGSSQYIDRLLMNYTFVAEV